MHSRLELRSRVSQPTDSFSDGASFPQRCAFWSANPASPASGIDPDKTPHLQPHLTLLGLDQPRRFVPVCVSISGTHTGLATGLTPPHSRITTIDSCRLGRGRDFRDAEMDGDAADGDNVPMLCFLILALSPCRQRESLI